MPQPQFITIPEYLAGEEHSPVKHEYLGGAVHAMSCNINRHGVIAGNALGLLFNQLRGKRCQPFNSDTKVRIDLPTHSRFYYPDAMMRHVVVMFLAAVGAVSCVSKPSAPAVAPLAPRARIVAPDAPAGPVKVDVSLATMTAQLLAADGGLLAEMDISPGMAGHETPLGRFRVTEKLPLKRSNRYGQYVKPDTREVVVAKHWEHRGPKPPGTVYQGIAMPFWMRLTDDGVGMHVGAFTRGQPTSKGCIRCPEEGQRFFYQRCRAGTPVRIHTGRHPADSVLGGPQ